MAMPPRINAKQHEIMMYFFIFLLAKVQPVHLTDDTGYRNHYGFCVVSRPYFEITLYESDLRPTFLLYAIILK